MSNKTRITLRVEPEVASKVQAYIPDGLRSKVIEFLLVDFLELMEEADEPATLLNIYLRRQFKPMQLKYKQEVSK